MWQGRQRWQGRRQRDLYDRRAQRRWERWPVVARALAGPLRRPELALRLLGAAEPIERDGRVLHPGVQALLTAVNRFEGSASNDGAADEKLDPFVLRRQLRRSTRVTMPVRTDVHVSGRVVPGPGGASTIGMRTYRQFGTGLGGGRAGPGQPAIVFFHGGGWVTGDLDSHDALCRILSVASGCQVVAVDYRLAPEDPFPAAVDDAMAAYAWVHAHSAELGAHEHRIAVMGDSAGANLAAVVAQLSREASRSVPPPVAQGLVYPVVDARLGFESMRSLGDGFLLTRPIMEFYRDQYLPDRADWEDPRASPLLAADLSGLAPALVVTAGFDPLRDDGTHYAEALRRAGVAVEHRRCEDQIHGFTLMGIVPDALALTIEVCQAMGWLVRHPERAAETPRAAETTRAAETAPPAAGSTP